MQRWRAGALLFTLAVIVVGAAGGPARADGDDVAWARLGPPGPRRVGAIAVAADWPEDRLLLAARSDDLIRSRDGGATWELLSSRPAGLATLVLAPPFGGVRSAFALTDQGGTWTLHRSIDDGLSWEAALALPARPTLAVSPDFARDGLALLVGDGRLFRTRDGGASWWEVDPAGGRRVQQALFSPAFGRDQTLFLAVTSGDFPSIVNDRPAEVPSADHALSPGVLLSTDGGESWTTASAGLEIGETPHRHVRSLTISPTFEEDGTLFAFAWGPRRPGQAPGGGDDPRYRTQQAALFRSRDRGASWAPVRVFEPSASWVGTAPLALSPTFAADGVGLLGVNSAYITPASSGCLLLRTADRGDTWQDVIRRGSYEGCADLQLVGADPLTGLVYKNAWLRSPDGGLSWEPLLPPDGSVASVAPARAAGRDRTLFVGTSGGGLWALGPSARSTDGRLPCAFDARDGFGRVWESEPSIRTQLGCPLDPEIPVRIRERRFAESLGYWTEDDRSEWFELFERTTQFWSLRSKAELPWSEQPDRVLDGAIQRFEGGTMLFLPRSDADRAVIVLIGDGSDWRELPD